MAGITWRCRDGGLRMAGITWRCRDGGDRSDELGSHHAFRDRVGLDSGWRIGMAHDRRIPPIPCAPSNHLNSVKRIVPAIETTCFTSS